MSNHDTLPEATRANLQTIIKLEEEQDRLMTPAERLSESIAGFAGSIWFVVVELAVVIVWIAINLGIGPAPLTRFDPAPFSLLGAVLSLEGVLLTAFVLIRQNRMSRKAEHRSHLDLQINLLSEQAVTKIIQMLDSMSRQMGIEEGVADAETKELAKQTVIQEVSRELRETLEADSEIRPVEVTGPVEARPSGRPMKPTGCSSTRRRAA